MSRLLDPLPRDFEQGADSQNFAHTLMCMYNSEPYHLVKFLRKLNGFTQKQLADLCGVSRSHISNIEQGECPDPSWSTMISIFKACGIHYMVYSPEMAKKCPIRWAEDVKDASKKFRKGVESTWPE